jgi:hypothetical protein
MVMMVVPTVYWRTYTVHDVIQGQGRLQSANGDVYTWKGMVRVVLELRYVGTFVNSEREGQGTVSKW